MANTQMGEMIAASGSLGISYAERLLKDVPSAEFSRFARPGGQVVQSNHPAFIFGHLSLYAARVVGDLEGDLTNVKPPETFACLFSKGATCQDDPPGTIYPAMDVILERFFTSHQAALQLLRNTPDDTFLGTNPTEGRLRELFPTIGAMHAFYVSGHMMTHLGQMSAWRRMMGMDAA